MFQNEGRSCMKQVSQKTTQHKTLVLVEEQKLAHTNTNIIVNLILMKYGV